MTFLMGISRVSLMTRMEALGLYEFGRWDYFIRIGTLFLVCSIFLSANIFYNKVNLGPIKFNLLNIKGILLFNLLIFIPIQLGYVFLTMQQVELPVSDRIPVERGGVLIVWAMMTNLALMLVSALVGTVYRFMRENYQINLKNEMLQKESAEARFANLKEQLNPHFLFNSFSTLNGLIDESPSKAKKFVHDMSDVYRYVLKNEHVDKVSLKEEMEFAKIYLSMIKERFGDSIGEVIVISKEAMEMKVPPLAIQMLIENAVKHNNFNPDHPLNLSIQSADQNVRVKNSLKERQVTGNHSLGLYNLNQRYKYMSNREVIIKKTNETFEVKIPLLQ
ncbi:MAG: histidine kinase [Reichenbachiella sp.]|uniref:sensor histidine kinase n=1 Tax=Reichenbachiella sp. TaxID=2184521 RepID=UPI003298A7ED